MGILPPGFRFHPTDVELVMYYLKRKLMKKKFQFEAMAELNVYKYEPWDLADKSLLRRDLEWYFFTPRERKYGSGARTNRATETGYWKATGKDRPVMYSNRTVGMIKTLIFYKGHAPKGERTDWVMHEYRIEDKNLSDVGIIQDSYVICKIFQKSGLGPKNGAQYGAPFSEEEWNEVESADEEDGPFLTEHLQPSNHNTAVSLARTTTSCSMTMSKVVQCPTQPLAISQPCSTADPSEGVVSWLPICTDVAKHSIENYTTENTNVFKSPQGTQGPITNVAFSEEVNNAREICAIPLPVNGQVLSVHSSYRDLENLGSLNSIFPGTTSSWPLSEPGLQGPSAASTLVTDMPYDLPEDDITALLSMFSEDSSMISIENNEFNTVHTDQSVKAQMCVDKISIFTGLGDLNNSEELRKSGFDFSKTCDATYTPNTMLLDDDMIFLELKDLDSPLKHPAEARESLRGLSDSSYSPYNCYRNLDASFCASNLPKSVQNVSRLNSTSFPPEGPRWMEDIVEVSRKGPDNQNLENYGSHTFMGNNIPFQNTRRQPEGSNIASQIQRRGNLHRIFRLHFSLESIYALLSVAELFAHIIAAEKLNDSQSRCGSSTIYFKAEVALKVGECTEDALSHDMGESNCMCLCWGSLPKNKLGKNNQGLRFEIISHQWIVLSLLGKIIVRRAYLINMIINWLILLRPFPIVVLPDSFTGQKVFRYINDVVKYKT